MNLEHSEPKPMLAGLPKKRTAQETFCVTIKTTVLHDTKKPSEDAYPGMMGDEAKEQKLDLHQRGIPTVRILNKKRRCVWQSAPLTQAK